MWSGMMSVFQDVIAVATFQPRCRPAPAAHHVQHDEERARRLRRQEAPEKDRAALAILPMPALSENAAKALEPSLAVPVPASCAG